MMQPHVLRDHESTIIPKPLEPRPDDLACYIAHVPVARFIEMDTDACLRELETYGVQVDRGKGSSAIDQARCIRASHEVQRGAHDSMLFIDSDMKFEPKDAITLFRRPEPVVAGVYAAKCLGIGQMNAWFGDAKEVKFGDWAPGLYPVKRIGGGFLRIKIDFLKRMIRELKLPYCRSGNTFMWPFFQPAVIEECGEHRYLTEDYAFAWRCEQMGVPILADTSFRLWHMGDYPYGIEEADGVYVPRAARYLYKVPDGVAPNPPEIPDDCRWS